MGRKLLPSRNDIKNLEYLFRIFLENLFFNGLKDNEISCFEEGGYCDSKTSSTCVSGNLNENLCFDSERACCMGGLPATTTITTTTTKRPTTEATTTQSTTDYSTDDPETPGSAENFAISAIRICSIFIFHFY